MEEFRKVLTAVGRLQHDLWEVADAVVEEIERKNGRAKHGECKRCAAYLAGEGFREWTAERIRQIHQTGNWVNSSARRTDFRKHSFERVRAAKDAAGSDCDQALKMLDDGLTRQEIRELARSGKANPKEVSEDLLDAARKAKGDHVVTQARDAVEASITALEATVRAMTVAIEHRPDRRDQIEVILRDLEKRAPGLIAKAARAVREATEPQRQLELEG